MVASLALRAQIEQVLDQLDPEQLARLWDYIRQLRQGATPPLYRLHEEAISTGVRDLAEKHDRCLYGNSVEAGAMEMEGSRNV